MPATRQLPLTVEQKEALLELGSRGPGAEVDPESLCGLARADMVQVNKARRAALMARGEMAYAYLTDRAATLQRFG